MYQWNDRLLGTGVDGYHCGIKELMIHLKKKRNEDRMRGSVTANTMSNVKTSCQGHFHPYLKKTGRPLTACGWKMYMEAVLTPYKQYMQ
jgi:hypothetical protein